MRKEKRERESSWNSLTLRFDWFSWWCCWLRWGDTTSYSWLVLTQERMRHPATIGLCKKVVDDVDYSGKRLLRPDRDSSSSLSSGMESTSHVRSWCWSWWWRWWCGWCQNKLIEVGNLEGFLLLWLRCDPLSDDYCCSNETKEKKDHQNRRSKGRYVSMRWSGGKEEEDQQKNTRRIIIIQMIKIYI